MTTVFADTSYYLALLSADDEHHSRAAQLSMQLRRAVVMTDP